MFGNIGVPELLIIFAIVLLIFGANKVPEVARSLGKGIRAFRAEASKMREELESAAKVEEEAKKATEAQTKPEGEAEVKEAELELQEPAKAKQAK